jgi:hypothetical protein
MNEEYSIEDEVFWWKLNFSDKSYTIKRKTNLITDIGNGFTKNEALQIGEQLSLKQNKESYYVPVEINGENFYVKNIFNHVTLPLDKQGNPIKTLDKNLFYEG